MKNKVLFTGVGLLLSCVTWALDGEKREERTVKVEKNDVILSAELDEKCVAGHLISLTITLSNHGMRAVRFDHIDGYHDFNVALKNDKGNLVPLTIFGSRMIGGAEMLKHDTKSLASGMTYSINLNLSRLFDISIAGKYYLTVEKKIDEKTKDEFALKISDHAFTVEEPPYDLFDQKKDEMEEKK